MLCPSQFQSIIHETQSCSNNNLLYVTNLGSGGSGFGSEFNFYFVYALMTAILKRSRMVFVKYHVPFQYDCPSKSGWACYFKFPCNDSVIAKDEFDRLNPPQAILDYKDIDKSRDFNYLVSSFGNEIPEKSVLNCNREHMNPTILTGLVSKHLYQLNADSKHFVKKFNHRYGFEDIKYIAIQMRGTDKKAEVDHDIWNWISNMSNIYTTILPYLKDYKYVFIATDDCLWYENLMPLIPKDITVMSPCNSNNHISQEHSDLTGTFNPRQNNVKYTLRLLADIQMLVQADHYFGLTKSNMVRMIYKLRSNLSTSHALAKHLTDMDINTREDNLYS